MAISHRTIPNDHLRMQICVIALALQLPLVTKTEFLLTISNNIKQASDEMKYQEGDYLLNVTKSLEINGTVISHNAIA